MTTAFKNLSYFVPADPSKPLNLCAALDEAAPSLNEDDEKMSGFLSEDPYGSRWSTLGLVPATTEGDIVHDLDGKGTLLCVQVNERILPGKVRDEQVARIVADIAEREGRKVGKKEFREVRDEVELELLPKAFIRRAPIFVMIDKQDNLYVFSSSAKKCDDVLTLLTALFINIGVKDPAFNSWHNVIDSNPTNFMLALCEGDDPANGSTLSFHAGNSGVLRNDSAEATPTHRIKNRDFSSEEVGGMLKLGYRPTEMEVVTFSDGEAEFSFKLNDKMVIKGFSFDDTALTRHDMKAKDPSTLHAFAWLTLSTLQLLIRTLELAISQPDTEDDL